MAQGKRELSIQCSFTRDGESLQDILKECFRTFLHKEVLKSEHF